MPAASARRPPEQAAVAVGYSVDSGGDPQTLVETREGTTWSVTSTPSPSPSASLNGVSCGSATSCVAVGWTGDSIRQTLVETWSGTAWSAWEPMGGLWTASPSAVCRPGTTTVDLFERGTDNAIWTTSVTGS